MPNSTPPTTQISQRRKWSESTSIPFCNKTCFSKYLPKDSFSEDWLRKWSLELKWLPMGGYLLHLIWIMQIDYLGTRLTRDVYKRQGYPHIIFFLEKYLKLTKRKIQHESVKCVVLRLVLVDKKWEKRLDVTDKPVMFLCMCQSASKYNILKLIIIIFFTFLNNCAEFVLS